MTDRICAARLWRRPLLTAMVFVALSCGGSVRAQNAVQAAAQSAAPAAQSAGGGIDAAEERKIAEMVAASGAPSVSVAVVENGKLTYAKAFGKASLDPTRAADTNTRYAVGSISKHSGTSSGK